MEELQIQTQAREEMITISDILQNLIDEKGWEDGIIFLHCPHTTAALTINEGADPDVMRDIIVNMRSLVPLRGDYHHAEGNSDAHIKSSMFGCDQMVMIEKGLLQLGRWQKLFFCEFGGPRSRSLWVKFMRT
ncbi:MAG: secondary thiamine-phosphate synthase enzyme YjbQ [Alphaproteobacteria bacterium]